MAETDSLPSKRLAVGGYEREIHYTPSLVVYGDYCVAFKLVLLGAPRRHDPEDGVIMAQHLLAAADMYGIDRLKLMCEDRLCDGTDMETAATALGLAEQHGCSKLKARCLELIAANLDAVIETEGYKHLMESSPLVMNDLIRAVRRRKN
ncbi:unnamed protein product [Urochloa decumbens]|uniref:BPM/SPOP BACK domain-containing protein n=1 Tax=Urochloa decumbens TaxID=240449 RepID=A0ABC9EBF7_9POAL